MNDTLKTAICAATLFLCLVLPSTSSAAAGDRDLTITDFAIVIDEGPSTAFGPLMLWGNLRLKVDRDGGFTGRITPADGESSVASGGLAVENPQSVKIAGQITGRAFNLIVDLGGGRYIFGAGTSQYDPLKKGEPGVFGGAAVGPGRGDKGEWGVKTYICPADAWATR